MVSRLPMLLIIVAILVVGFVGGYIYSLNTVKQLTTVTRILSYTTTQYVSLSPLTITTTKLLNLTHTETLTVTTTVVDVLTRLTTITAPPEIKLTYPLRSSAELDINGDGTLDVFVEINPWNMKSYRGMQQILIDLVKRTIRVEFNLTDVQPAEWTNGYPEVYIGRKPWGGRYANGFRVKFPMKLGEITPFTVSFYMCVEDLETSMNFNIAADAWIVNEQVALRPTTPPKSGDLELMVWLYKQNLNPAGRNVGEETIPIVVNGTKINAVFEVWREDSVSWGGWQYIAFAPKGWSLRCGHVAYDPTLFVKMAAKYATFDVSGHYLLGWEMGTEWGARLSNGVARFVWVLRDFVAIPGTSIQP